MANFFVRVNTNVSNDYYVKADTAVEAEQFARNAAITNKTIAGIDPEDCEKGIWRVEAVTNVSAEISRMPESEDGFNQAMDGRILKDD